MKNSKWILGLISALSLQVSAKDFSKIEKAVNTGLSKRHVHATVHLRDNPAPSPGPTPPTPAPIRQANVKVLITKTTLTKNSSGGYDSIDEVVCNATALANVYDVRGMSDYTIPQTDFDYVQCPSTLNNAPTVVHFGGPLMIQSGELFGTVQDFKMSSGLLYADAADLSGMAFSNAGSSDLGAKSILETLYPSGAIVSCSTDTSGTTTCSASLNEYFNAVVDTQD